MRRLLQPFIVSVLLPGICPAAGVQLELADELLIVTRSKAAATNARLGNVERMALRKGAMTEMLTPAIEARLRDCPAAAATGAKVVVSPARMRDKIGDSGSRLEAVGVYMIIPESDRAALGAGFVAPYAALAIRLVDAAGRTISTAEIAGYDKRELPADTTFAAYLGNGNQIPEAVRLTTQRLVEQSFPTVFSTAACGK